MWPVTILRSVTTWCRSCQQNNILLQIWNIWQITNNIIYEQSPGLSLVVRHHCDQWTQTWTLDTLSHINYNTELWLVDTGSRDSVLSFDWLTPDTLGCNYLLISMSTSPPTHHHQSQTIIIHYIVNTLKTLASKQNFGGKSFYFYTYFKSKCLLFNILVFDFGFVLNFW